jgi:hypothetical protein
MASSAAEERAAWVGTIKTRVESRLKDARHRAGQN